MHKRVCPLKKKKIFRVYLFTAHLLNRISKLLLVMQSNENENNALLQITAQFLLASVPNYVRFFCSLTKSLYFDKFIVFILTQY